MPQLEPETTGVLSLSPTALARFAEWIRHARTQGVWERDAIFAPCVGYIYSYPFVEKRGNASWITREPSRKALNSIWVGGFLYFDKYYFIIVGPKFDLNLYRIHKNLKN